MNLAWIILISNTVTMLITITASIKRPIPSYRVIAGTAVIAFVLSLHQVVTGHHSIYSLIFTALLPAAIFWRIALNLKEVRTKK